MRVKGSVATRKRRKKVLDLAKGYVGSKHALFRVANEQVLHSLSYAYRDRRNCKRNFRSLWIRRLNAAAHVHGLSYSQFIQGLKKVKIVINRKMLSEIAIDYPQSFQIIIDQVKTVL